MNDPKELGAAVLILITPGIIISKVALLLINKFPRIPWLYNNNVVV
jgi:hypothetical protein